MPELERRIYKEFPPERRNARFREIYYELPNYRVEIPMFKSWVIDVIDRREQEGTLDGLDLEQFVDHEAMHAVVETPEAQAKLRQKARLLEETKDLTDSAIITGEFRVRIHGIFENKWESEIPPINYVTPEVLFDDLHPRSGGIWVPNRAVIIERQAVKLEEETNEDLKTVLASGKGSDKLIELVQRREAELIRWKESFARVHGEPA